MASTDKEKALEYELGRMKKMVKDRNRELSQLRLGAEDSRKIMEAYMIRTALRYGHREPVGEDEVEHCLALPRLAVEETLEKWEIRGVGQNEDGDILIAAMKREEEAK